MLFVQWCQIKNLRVQLAVAQHVTNEGRDAIGRENANLQTSAKSDSRVTMGNLSAQPSSSSSSVVQRRRGDTVLVLDGGEAYHRYECQYVRRSTKPRKVFYACTQCFRETK